MATGNLAALLCASQLEEEDSIRNASLWAMKEYYANFSMPGNDTDATPPPMDPSDVIRGPCWETAVGVVRTNSITTLHLFRPSVRPPIGLIPFSVRLVSISGVCEADGLGHPGHVPDHPDRRLCPGRHRPIPQLLLVLGPGGWVCKLTTTPNTITFPPPDYRQGYLVEVCVKCGILQWSFSVISISSRHTGSLISAATFSGWSSIKE